jgi:uncharacterized protein (UPF0264 family)
MNYSAPPWNPKHLVLQDRPDKYGGKYSQEELDKFIKRAHKNGYTMIYGGRTKNNKLNVRKEMKRINEMKEKKKVLSKKKGSTKKGKKNSSKRP